MVQDKFGRILQNPATLNDTMVLFVDGLILLALQIRFKLSSYVVLELKHKVEYTFMYVFMNTFIHIHTLVINIHKVNIIK